MIKAIQTRYNGYHFRSRIEARWAVFLDALGIKYEYEAEGYELNEAGRYLPDFWLPEQGHYIEIKGHKNVSEKELIKCAALAMEHPVVVFCGNIEAPVLRNGVVVGGCDASSFKTIKRMPSFTAMRDSGGLRKAYNMPWYTYELKSITGSSVLFIHEDWQHGAMLDDRPHFWHERNDGSFHVWPYPSMEFSDTPTGKIAIVPSDESSSDYINIVPQFTTRSLNSPRLIEAYNAARSARFEYGERP